MPEPFLAFDAEVAAAAREAAAAGAGAARLAQRLRRAAERVDLHEMRQNIDGAVARAEEAAARLAGLRDALRAAALHPGSPAAEEAAASASGPAGDHAVYAEAFEGACAAEGLPLEGSYPDYRVFPFSVRIRLAEERALIGRKSWWALRPAALARAVRAERDRLMGGAFAAERFGAALASAHDLLAPPGEPDHGGAVRPSARQVPLREVLAVLQLGTFGRSQYTRDQFAFDLYRYRQTPMRVGARRVVLDDMRQGGGGFEVPNARGGFDRLVGLQLAPAEDGADAG